MRPPDLIYAQDETPPPLTLAALGFQHVAVICVRARRELVEEQSFVSGLSGYLSGLGADRVERSANGEDCVLKLLFRMQ